MLIDITRTVGLDTLVYPGDTGPRLTRTDSFANGDGFNASRLEFSAHVGTHLDSPAHFVDGAPMIAELPVERFNVPALVVDTGEARVITREIVDRAGVEPGDAVLFKTVNGQLPRDSFTNDFVHLDVSAASRLVELEASLVGIDYLSVEPDTGDPDVPVHKMLLGAGLIIMEDADLRHVAPGRYRLMCFPLKLHDTEASPCRAVLKTV